MLNPPHFIVLREFLSCEGERTIVTMHSLLWWTTWLFLPRAAEAIHGGPHIIQDLNPPNLPPCLITSGNFRAYCIPLFIGWLIQWILGFLGAICIINIMIGGFQIAFGSAMGDREAGKSRVLWALVGLFICIVAYGLLDLVLSTLGFL